jgi:aspartyl-tRNA(Asn)/glutamyl-tRNA(Gln) amidotransferase subunit A
MPTYGRVPKSGCIPLGYSLDHIGPLARSARDCASVLNAIAGYDPSDPTCSDRPVPDYLESLSKSVEGLRIGVDRVHHLRPDTDPVVVERFDAALAVLRGHGAIVTEICLPHFAEGAAATMITISAEALAYHHSDLASRWDDYTPGFRMIAARGALASSSDYVQAQRVRRHIQSELAALLTDLDAVVMPTASVGAPRYDDLLAGAE